MPSYSIVDKPNVSLINGDAVEVKLSVYPKNSTFTTYTVTSANTDVATVTSTGENSTPTNDGRGFIETRAPDLNNGSPITFTVQKGSLASGNTTISITNGDPYAPTTVISVISLVPVNPMAVALQRGEVTVSTLSLATPVAGSAAETADLNLVLNNTATNTTVYWGSSNPLVATVNETGLVTAVSNGSATISAYTQDGGLLASRIVKTCTVSVGQSPYTKVSDIAFACPTGLTYTLYPVGLTLPAQGTNAQVGTPIPVTVSFTAPNPTNKVVYYGTTDQNVAKVQLNSSPPFAPELIPVGYGKVTITAFSADASKVKTLAFEFKPVDKPVPAVLAFSPAAPVVGTPPDAYPTLAMESGSTAKVPLTTASLASSAFFYCYDKSGFVSVDSTGLITATAPGTGYVFVYSADGTKTGTLAVTVTTPLVALLLDQTGEIRLQTGSTYPLTVTRIPSSATGGTIAWSSSTPAYVAVSTTGVVSALATGPSRITATCGQIISSDVLIRSLGKVILFDPYDISPQGYMSVVDGVNTLTMVEGIKYNITTVTDPTCGVVEWREVNNTGDNISSGLNIVEAGNLAVVSVKPGQTGATNLKAASTNGIYFRSAFDTLKINMVAATPLPTGFAIDVANIKSDDGNLSVPNSSTAPLTVRKGKAYYIPVSFADPQPSNYTVTWSATPSDGGEKLTVTPNSGLYPSCNILVPSGTYTSASWTLTATASDGTTTATLTVNL